MPENVPLSYADIDSRAKYVPVSPQLIRPWSKSRFAVYLFQDDNYVLYTTKGESYTAEHRKKLNDIGVETVYIPREQLKEYESYLRENLADILRDEAIPLEARSRAWYQASMALVKGVFEDKLPERLFRTRFSHMKRLMRDSINLFKTPESLKHITQLISKGYQNYHHGLGTMVLNYFVLQSYDCYDEDTLLKCSLGAILHDIGKTTLPQEILEKRPETMSAEEREIYRSHPSRGVSISISLELAKESQYSILFHHEKENGQGYPSGMTADKIPFYVKTLSLCNVYDSLTRTTVYRPAFTPYEALSRIEVRRDMFNHEVIKRMIMILSNAEVIDQAKYEKVRNKK